MTEVYRESEKMEKVNYNAAGDIVRGFWQAAMFANDEHPNQGEYVGNFGESWENLTADEQEKIINYCANFLLRLGASAELYGKDVKGYVSVNYTIMECIGHDLYFTSSGAGVGFWDRKGLSVGGTAFLNDADTGARDNHGPEVGQYDAGSWYVD